MTPTTSRRCFTLKILFLTRWAFNVKYMLSVSDRSLTMTAKRQSRSDWEEKRIFVKKQSEYDSVVVLILLVQQNYEDLCYVYCSCVVKLTICVFYLFLYPYSHIQFSMFPQKFTSVLFQQGWNDLNVPGCIHFLKTFPCAATNTCSPVGVLWKGPTAAQTVMRFNITSLFEIKKKKVSTCLDSSAGF